MNKYCHLPNKPRNNGRVSPVKECTFCIAWMLENTQKVHSFTGDVRPMLFRGLPKEWKITIKQRNSHSSTYEQFATGTRQIHLQTTNWKIRIIFYLSGFSSILTFCISSIVPQKITVHLAQTTNDTIEAKSMFNF